MCDNIHQIKLCQPLYLKNINLANLGIGIREAARLYGIQPRTIDRWVNRGYVRIIGIVTGRGGKKYLVDHADIAYCVSIYKANPVQGRKLFNQDGTPRL